MLSLSMASQSPRLSHHQIRLVSFTIMITVCGDGEKRQHGDPAHSAQKFTFKPSNDPRCYRPVDHIDSIIDWFFKSYIMIIPKLGFWPVSVWLADFGLPSPVMPTLTLLSPRFRPG